MDYRYKPNAANAIFVEPEMIEDIPLTGREKWKESMRNARRAVRSAIRRLPRPGVLLMAVAALLILLALVAMPYLPAAALLIAAVLRCRSAFRAQTAA